MPGFMYPAYQKFYASICSLMRFNKEKDFFDNIASMDNFFSEYRSTTLVMQKSLSKTPYEEIYKQKSEGIWDKFFNDQRVKTIHQHPFEFTKTIQITLYFPNGGRNILSETFTVENDVPLITLENELKEFFHSIKDNEIFFSANYTFKEKESDDDLWDKLMLGINTLQIFMDDMYKTINENCPLCDKLREEINKAGFGLIPRDFFLTNDYVYYLSNEVFERAERMAMIFPGMNRQSLKGFMNLPLSKSWDTTFEKFVMMHIVMQSTDLMPVLMTVYQDETFELDVFHADIKTTIYRKINETAKKVLKEDVKEVFFMNTYICCEVNESNLKATSKERIKMSQNEVLVFMKVDQDMNEEEYVFECKKLNNIEYIAKNMKIGKKRKLEIGATNLNPIIEAFMLLKEQPINANK